jgi:pimeloyl-ACP methyl ester carboxylesterase
MISTSIIDNLTIRESILGNNGDTVLMLHGWGANLDLMLPLGERLANLNYRVYIPDLPGFGETQPPPVSWSVGDYVLFVLAYLDHHRLERVHLFGHSFGGRLSLVLGAEHADRIGKIVLSNSAGVRPKTPLTSQIRLNSYKTIRNRLREIGLNLLADRLQVWYTARYGSADYRSASGVMRETFVKVVGENLLPYAARMKPSTLLLWGDKDEDTPLWQGKLLEKTIPDAGLVVYEGAGHYAYLERLAEAARVTHYFYKEG